MHSAYPPILSEEYTYETPGYVIFLSSMLGSNILLSFFFSNTLSE
jgi:hypothetical protein